MFGWSPINGNDSTSLMDVLRNDSGVLDSHAVGALLNAAHSSVDFGATVDDVIKAYDMARDNPTKYEVAVKEVFDKMNNLGCPL